MGMFFHDRGEAPPERPADPEVRRANMRRIGQLFKPYWRRLSGLLGLIVVSAGLGVLPAFLLRRVLIAIQAHDTRGVSAQRGRDDRDRDRRRHPRRDPDAALEPGRAARDARPARRRLPPPAAPLAGLLHAHPHGRGAVTDQQRHRRRAERRHEHRDEHHVECDDGRRDDDRHALPELAARAVRVRADPVVRGADAPGRQRAATDREDDAGVARRHLEHRPGVALGQRDPAREDDGAQRRARRPLRGRVASPGRPRGAAADGGPLGDGLDPDELLGHAGGGLLARRHCLQQPTSRSRRSSRSPRCRRGSSSRSARCSASGSTSRPRSRSSTGSSSTSTRPSTSPSGRTRSRSPRPATSSTTASGSATAKTPGRCRT